MSRDGIRDKAAIVGVGCCRFGENWDQSPSDMIVDAAYEAYADAGIEDPQKQIDAVFTGSLYSQAGPHECADALKLFDKPVSMVSNYCATGTDAFRYGVMSIAAGMYERVLVVGYDKPKDRGVSGPSVMMDGEEASRIMESDTEHYITHPDPNHRYLSLDHFVVDHEPFLRAKKTMARLASLRAPLRSSYSPRSMPWAL